MRNMAGARDLRDVALLVMMAFNRGHRLAFTTGGMRDAGRRG